mmetsp:Transcript_28327/g.91168  ORF Transcript_28327/g.91168 Transcript_28327/m.91168 type:complete len:235 (+) Transcript_28327:41-745(+)
MRRPLDLERSSALRLLAAAACGAGVPDAQGRQPELSQIPLERCGGAFCEFQRQRACEYSLIWSQLLTVLQAPPTPSKVRDLERCWTREAPSCWCRADCPPLAAMIVGDASPIPPRRWRWATQPRRGSAGRMSAWSGGVAGSTLETLASRPSTLESSPRPFAREGRPRSTLGWCGTACLESGRPCSSRRTSSPSSSTSLAADSPSPAGLCCGSATPSRWSTSARWALRWRSTLAA